PQLTHTPSPRALLCFFHLIRTPAPPCLRRRRSRRSGSGTWRPPPWRSACPRIRLRRRPEGRPPRSPGSRNRPSLDSSWLLLVFRRDSFHGSDSSSPLATPTRHDAPADSPLMTQRLGLAVALSCRRFAFGCAWFSAAGGRPWPFCRCAWIFESSWLILAWIFACRSARSFESSALYWARSAFMAASSSWLTVSVTSDSARR